MVTTRSGLVSDKPRRASTQHKKNKTPGKKNLAPDKKKVEKPLKPVKNPAKKKQAKPAGNPNPPKRPDKTPKKLSPKPPKSPKNTKNSPPRTPNPTSEPDPKSSNHSLYSFDQYQTYKKHKEELNEKALQELKDQCKKNGMKVSGNKTDLVERIADAKVLGVIPKCPSCAGGRPKLNPKTKIYFCTGYQEDTVFKNCHKTFAYSEIVREPYKET